MIILTIRTDKPEAEIGLYEDGRQLAYETWQAHRELAETLHTKIAALLRGQSRSPLSDKDIGDNRAAEAMAIVVYRGPGSFTGLRIGLTVANALAYTRSMPIVATMGEDWIRQGIRRLLEGESDTIALPEYGGEANITLPGNRSRDNRSRSV